MGAKMLSNYKLHKADGKNLLFDCYVINDTYVFYCDDDTWYIQEYNYNTNEVGNVYSMHDTLEDCLLYVNEIKRIEV